MLELFQGVTKAEQFAGWDALLLRVGDSTWWDWDIGLAPIYWQWHVEYWLVIWDGLPIWFSGDKLCWRRPQKAEQDEVSAGH
jgi:hypothetical protein